MNASLTEGVPTTSTCHVESALQRAERRQLEQATQDSLLPVKQALTPQKEPEPGTSVKMLQKSLIVSPGTEQKIDINNLPSLQVTVSTGFLDKEEKEKLKDTKATHFAFLMSIRTAPLV